MASQPWPGHSLATLSSTLQPSPCWAGLPALQGGLAADIMLCGLGTTFLGLSFLGDAPTALESLRCAPILAFHLAPGYPLPANFLLAYGTSLPPDLTTGSRSGREIICGVETKLRRNRKMGRGGSAWHGQFVPIACTCFCLQKIMLASLHHRQREAKGTAVAWATAHVVMCEHAGYL